MTEAGLVLAIDDDPSILDLVRMALEDEGYGVVTAADGADALALLEGCAPGLILLDMRMGGVNGWEFAEAYRRRPGPHAPIVVITAARDAAGRAAEIGAEGYLGKPFGLQELSDVVSRHILKEPPLTGEPTET